MVSLLQTNERHIAALERQIEQARVGYEKHIDEVGGGEMVAYVGW